MTKLQSWQDNSQPLRSRFKDQTAPILPSLSENPPVLTQSEPPLSPSAENAESTAQNTDSMPTLSENTRNGAKPDLELLALVLKTTVENLEAAGLCWRTTTKDGKYLRVVFRLDRWSVDMELKP